MRALTSCALSAKLVQALETEWRWQVDKVDSVKAATAELSAADRASVRAILVEAEPVTAALMDALPNLEVIAAMRSEPVNVDMAAASERALPVIHTPGRNAESVADFTLGLTLAMLRSIAVTHHKIMSGDLTRADSRPHEVDRTVDVIWRPDDPAGPIPYLAYKGRELSGLVIGVIGYGAVGTAVARRFRPLVREVIVVDPAVPEDSVAAAG
jgi:D-3-phosphoglycerate dehydrogenase